MRLFEIRKCPHYSEFRTEKRRNAEFGHTPGTDPPLIELVPNLFTKAQRCTRLHRSCDACSDPFK